MSGMFFPFRRKSPRFFGLFSFARLSLERCFRRGCTLLAVWTSAMPSPRPIRRHIAGFSSTIRPPQERIGLFAEVFSRGKLPASTVQTECSHEMESRCAFNAESPKNIAAVRTRALTPNFLNSSPKTSLGPLPKTSPFASGGDGARHPSGKCEPHTRSISKRSTTTIIVTNPISWPREGRKLGHKNCHPKKTTGRHAPTGFNRQRYQRGAVLGTIKWPKAGNGSISWPTVWHVSPNVFGERS